MRYQTKSEENERETDINTKRGQMHYYDEKYFPNDDNDDKDELVDFL